MVELRNLKGTNDRNNEQSLIQNYLISIIKDNFELYGFNPLETPIMEFNDILASKYAGGTEITKEMYTLTDNGERNLALRYDLTVPLCRYIGMHERNLKFPYKRYEIGKIFRDGPVKLGRLREFYQCDADVIGSDDLLHDAECLSIIYDVFKKLGKDFIIELNSRKLLNGILKNAGIDDEDFASSIILSIDKLKKIGKDGVIKELSEKGISSITSDKIFEKIILENEGKSNEEIIRFYENKSENELILEGIDEVKTILKYCKKMGISNKVKFRPELARGLEIYTGPIFEAFYTKSEITSSIAAGGRYDKIIGKFLDKDKIIPAVGFSFGIEPIISDMLLDPKSYPHLIKKKTTVEVLIIPIKIEYDSIIPIIKNLRKKGLKCEIYMKKKKGIQGGLGLANYLGIPVTIIIGKNEIDTGKITVKNMIKEDQITIDVSKAPSAIKKMLKN